MKIAAGLIVLVMWFSGALGTGVALDSFDGADHSFRMMAWKFPAVILWFAWVPSAAVYLAITGRAVNTYGRSP